MTDRRKLNETHQSEQYKEKKGRKIENDMIPEKKWKEIKSFK